MNLVLALMLVGTGAAGSGAVGGGGGGGPATAVAASAFPLLAPNGSAAASSYSFTADGSMGMFRGPDPQLSFLTVLALSGGAGGFTDILNYTRVFGDLQVVNTGATNFYLQIDPIVLAGNCGGIAGSSVLCVDPGDHALKLSNNNAPAKTVAIDTSGGSAGAVLFRDTPTGSFKSASTLTFDGTTLALKLDGRAAVQPSNALISSNTGNFELGVQNASATNGGLIVASNNVGDSTYFGTTGSTGFSLAGATRAAFSVLQANATGGAIINVQQNVPLIIATNATVRETLDGAGHLTIAAPTATDAGSGTCTSVTVSANDRIGTVTATCLAGQTVKVNFGSTYSSAPTCISGAATDASATTTQMTITALVALTAAPVEFRCDIKG